MTEAQVFGELRALIGDPGVNDLSNRKLSSFVNFALAWMAEELEFRIVTDTLSMALTADQQDYPLPSDFLTLLWAEHNDRRLEPIGLSAEDRDQNDWRGAESGTPTQFAIRGRRLYLIPAPDSAAVSDDGFVSYSYVASPEAMGPSGPRDLSENDTWLLIYKAALQFCITNPNEQSATRIPGYAETVADLLQKAQGRWAAQGASAAKHFAPSFTPFTGRTGGAR